MPDKTTISSFNDNVSLSRKCRTLSIGDTVFIYKMGETISDAPIRSNPQNNSLHLYCTNLAKAFNSAGIDEKTIYASRTINLIDSETFELENGKNVVEIDGVKYVSLEWVFDLLHRISASLPFFNTQWTMLSVKNLWRKFQLSMFGKESTSKLTTTEVMDVYENLNDMTSKFGIHEPWPNKDLLNDLSNGMVK